MVNYEIIPATSGHILELAPHTREGDRAELWASLRATPEEAILSAFAKTYGAEAVMADKELICVYGVARVSIMSGVGYPWLMTHRDIKKHLRPFLRGTKAYIEKMKKRFDVLENCVDARNTDEIRWMRWMGFYIHSTEVHGIDQIPYHTFYMGGM